MQLSTRARALTAATAVLLTLLTVCVAVWRSGPEVSSPAASVNPTAPSAGATRGPSGAPTADDPFGDDRDFEGLSADASAPMYNPFDPDAGPAPEVSSDASGDSSVDSSNEEEAREDGSRGQEEAGQASDGASPSSAATPSTANERDERDDLARSVEQFRSAQRQLRRQAAARQRNLTTAANPEQPSTPSGPRHVFRVASYNVLGASHTGKHGHRKGFPAADTRMNMAIAALRANRVDVVGFQEFERTQHDMFTARADEYALYPGLSKGERSVRFNIAWRTSMWKLVEAHTIAVPYAGGNRIEMPVVLLESIATGRRAWFANFHNPADTPRLGNNARWRAEGTGIELAHLSQLHTDTGYPVVVTGDFNERAEIFCRFTGTGVFHAAAGGTSAGGCVPPPNMRVDWIFGSSDITFDGYAITGTGKASDHSLVHSQATLN